MKAWDEPAIDYPCLFWAEGYDDMEFKAMLEKTAEIREFLGVGE